MRKTPWRCMLALKVVVDFTEGGRGGEERRRGRAWEGGERRGIKGRRAWIRVERVGFRFWSLWFRV
jgi:hypothetical protein